MIALQPLQDSYKWHLLGSELIKYFYANYVETLTAF
jgi:hypothetical protein